jgi:undecaprenyl-diphosphatase
MIGFDRTIINFLNSFSQRSELFDLAIYHLNDIYLLKGGVVVAILWMLWFARSKEAVVAETRKSILATFAGTFLALLLAKILEYSLPFRPRPLNNPALYFHLPHSVLEGTYSDLSSFPSDHAVLFGGLAVGIFLGSRRFGILASLYIFLAIFIPRVYLGFHHPTDMIGGALLGAGCALLANVPVIKKRSMDPLMEWSERYPGWFYALFFLISYQTATLFDGVRYIGGFVLLVGKILVRNLLG